MRESTFRLVVEYDGTDFEGWQLQPGGRRTVQGCLEEGLERICGSRPRVRGAGRTDAGVHADGQVAGVRLATRLGPAELQRALNAVLPGDLAVIAIESAPSDFDPRRDALSKLYRYQIWNARVRSPRRARRWSHVPRPLDLASLVRAARHLEGTHDFSSLRASGSPVRSSVRTLHRVAVSGRSGNEIVLDFDGQGFLRQMVRNAVGTLIQVGLGRREPDSIPDLLAAGDRSRAGPTAPAAGLCLVEVRYPAAVGAPESPVVPGS